MLSDDVMDSLSIHNEEHKVLCDLAQDISNNGDMKRGWDAEGAAFVT